MSYGDHIRPVLPLSKAEYNLLSKYIQETYGISLGNNKKELLEYRLHRRLVDLKLPSYSDYINYLFSDTGKNTEPQCLINEVSTNKTDFFREQAHFDLLQHKILPKLLPNFLSRPLPIWSAGCSSGEEIYTLAIILEEFRKRSPSFNYQLSGSDVSEVMLKKAKKAIYPYQGIENIPTLLRNTYFLKGKGQQDGLVRVAKSIRDKANFFYLNLMDEEYRTPYLYPIIFCRNTLIYFNQRDKQQIIKKLKQRLSSDGLLFISHTESLVNMADGLRMVYPSVYQKQNN